MKSRFKSQAGAERRVRQLEKQTATLKAIAKKFYSERIMLAKLAAKGPAFFNPLHAMEAATVRDEILRKLNMNPDGSFIR